MDIDFVIAWVDGSDPNWQKEKAKFQDTVIENENNSINRYRDWGLLPYWFRAIEKFTPWVRKVHFITCGHVPAFLNLSAPKLHVVEHKEFISQEFLPTFSSHVIEMNLHRIPELSECFVYFNDDMFLLRPMGQEEFFKDNLPCSYGGEIPIELRGNVGTWQHAAVNDLGIINAHFLKREAVSFHRNKYLNKSYRWKDNLRTFLLEVLYPDYFTGFKNLHAPGAYLKRTFNEVWRNEPEKLISTCRDRFRTGNNVNQWVFLWWQIASGNFSPRIIDNYVNTVTSSSVDEICSVIKKQRHKMICINDPEEEIDFELLSEKLRNAFEIILPEKSEFEKKDSAKRKENIGLK